MERALWAAASGMRAQQVNMDVVSNNLANVNTSGFKRSRAEFQDLLYQSVNAPGTASSVSTNLPSGIQVGLGTRTVAIKRLFEQGDFRPTENPLDLVIEGWGFFKVIKPDGTTAYTRDGSFQIDQNGAIVNSLGYPLEPALTIPQDAVSITVGRDGTVSVDQVDGTVTQLGSIELANFVNPAGLRSLGGNLFIATESSGDALLETPGANGVGEIGQGFLETSNVSIVNELVNMITAQRAYELNSRAIRSSDEMLRQLAQLVR